MISQGKRSPEIYVFHPNLNFEKVVKKLLPERNEAEVNPYDLTKTPVSATTVSSAVDSSA